LEIKCPYSARDSNDAIEAVNSKLVSVNYTELILKKQNRCIVLTFVTFYCVNIIIFILIKFLVTILQSCWAKNKIEKKSCLFLSNNGTVTRD